MVPYNGEFGLFQSDVDGPLWRGCFGDLDEANRQAQKFADNEGLEFFVYSFRDLIEVARFFPSAHTPQG